jgi:hypothetical protein
MKQFENIFFSICLIFLLQHTALAQENPLRFFKAAAGKAITTGIKKHKLLNASFIYDPLACKPFIITKKPKHNIMAKVLNWDMKFKFRLSQNFNIIFSYN